MLNLEIYFTLSMYKNNSIIFIDTLHLYFVVASIFSDENNIDGNSINLKSPIVQIKEYEKVLEENKDQKKRIEELEKIINDKNVAPEPVEKVIEK
jgi:hypothetical protein